jgi:TPR repeat protein
MTPYRLVNIVQLFGQLSVLVVILIFSAPSFAGDFEDGMAALKRGERNKGEIILKRAAENGHLEAQYELGIFYQGSGRNHKNMATAIKWFRGPAENGHKNAQYALGRLLTYLKGGLENPAEGVRLLKSAADKGHAGAHYLLARAHYKGVGVPKNTIKAFKLYRKLAAQGHPAAMNMMGFYYAKGLDTPQNVKTANKWWRQAAEKGFAAAQYNLGDSYQRGRGVTANAKTAATMYDKAAKQGHKKAAAKLAALQKKNPNAGAAGKGGAKVAKAIKTAPQKRLPRNFPKPGPIVEHEGFRLIGSTYPKAKNKTFFKTVKFALKLAKELPPQFQQDIKLLKDIIYDPPSPLRKMTDISQDITGIYTILDRESAPAPVIIYKDLKWSSPVQVSMSLLVNSQYAKRHLERIALRKRLAVLTKVGETGTPEFKKLNHRRQILRIGLDKSNLKIVDKLECEILHVRFAAVKAWELDQRIQSATARALSTRKCW